MKRIIIFSCIMLSGIVSVTYTSAQSHVIDSLQKNLKNSTNDSVTVFLYSALANEYYSYDTLKSMQYLEKAFLLANKMKYDYALGDYYQVKAMLKQLNSDYESTHLYFDSAIFYFKKIINSPDSKAPKESAKLAMATSFGEKANILVKRGRTEEAIATYLSSLEAWKSSDNLRKNEAVGTYYTKISSLYFELKQYEKALTYDRLALSTFLNTNNDEYVAWALLYICNDFIALKQMDSCKVYLNKAKPIVEKMNNHRLNIQYYNKLAQISHHEKDYRTAIKYFEKTIEEAKITKNKFHILSNQRMIGNSYVKLGEYATARKYLLIALPGATSGNYIKEKMEILQELVTVEEKTNNIPQAYTYLKQVVALRDSVNQDNSRKAVAEIENKYQAAEKVKEIIQLNADKKIQALSLKQKSTLNYLLIGALVALLLVGFLGYRNLRHRQLLAKQQDQLQQQRISELEKDKQLVAVDSMLKGQEEERSRLAKDLHDGLGGLLSGVKFSLSNMKDNLIITPDNMAVFERSLDMIDISIKELRRVAHNMMPEMLTKFGLDEALKEYCNTINATNLLTVKYQSIGMETRIEKTSEIIIYRIIQELLNNIMKHAGAKQAIVQLIKEDGRFSIVVEDDGKGFDTDLMQESKGSGLVSIRSRVDYLKGQLDIHSDPGKGTLVNIEFNI